MLCRGPQRRAQERRRDEGTGKGAKEVTREEERRRDEGTREGAKEVARAAGGEAAGARVIGDRRMRWKEACYGGTGVMERSCAVARGKDINILLMVTA
jgi:hypothetical protein